MSEVEQAEQDLKALEAFVVDNPDLERLEALLDQFNIFEAIGVVRQELRHSDLLAFLLDSQESSSFARASSSLCITASTHVHAYYKFAIG
jgi:hypothetical protein